MIAPLGLSSIGNISIRVIIGTPVITPLVVLHIKLHTQQGECVNDDYTSVVFASCDQLNEDLILTVPVADQLYKLVQTGKGCDLMSTVDNATIAVTTRSQASEGFGAHVPAQHVYVQTETASWIALAGTMKPIF